ncbi:MAG: metallophosphoesterase [Pyrinomonadaceae bacterium]
MKRAGVQKLRIGQRISKAVSSDTPLRSLASNFSKVAKNAIDEANTLVVEKVSVGVKRLPSNLDGLRILHLSDTHHSPFTDINHIKRAVAITNELKPDFVFLTGDYVSHEKQYIAPVAEELGRLTAENGVFACLGNHDHWTDADLVTEELEAKGINVLVNSGLRMSVNGQSFWLCGVDDHMVRQTDLPAALAGSFPDEMKILLAHNPVILRQAARYGVDLMLSGHTHGGQVKLKENGVAGKSALRRKLSSGLHKKRNTQIYITRGIGTVVLPVRYQCPPEISELVLRCV